MELQSKQQKSSWIDSITGHTHRISKFGFLLGKNLILDHDGYTYIPARDLLANLKFRHGRVSAFVGNFTETNFLIQLLQP